MNRQKGIWAVAAVFLAYAALYWHYAVTAALPLDAQLSYFFASCSVICMVVGLLLSARPRPVEGAFGGLDRMYALHKYLGVAALLLFIAHYATLPEGGSAIFPEATGYLPGLRGRLNPVRDTHDRTYLYASNIAINEGERQPVHFIPGEELLLADADGARLGMRIIEIVGRSALVEYFTHPQKSR